MCTGIVYFYYYAYNYVLGRVCFIQSGMSSFPACLDTVWIQERMTHARNSSPTAFGQLTFLCLHWTHTNERVSYAELGIASKVASQSISETLNQTLPEWPAPAPS